MFERIVKWAVYGGTVIFFIVLLINNVTSGGLPVYESFDNYEVKVATHNAFGVQTGVVRNAWHWERQVKRIDIIHLSTTTVYCNFSVCVASFGVADPTQYSSDWYMIPASTSPYVKDNIFSFDITSDQFSIWIDTCTTPDIRVIGYGY